MNASIKNSTLMFVVESLMQNIVEKKDGSVEALADIIQLVDDGDIREKTHRFLEIMRGNE